jgi:nitroimidazol reductase NimA-like FMN-containing flavoprotein (pyridoxamine 5'-phosphate oxidase superfamily)
MIDSVGSARLQSDRLADQESRGTMADLTSDGQSPKRSPSPAEAGTGTEKAPLEPLAPEEAWGLISPGGIGRIGFSGRFGPMILPVNYKVHDQAIVFRTAEHSPMGEDLRTGIEHAEYKVAFEIDRYDDATRTGWSVLIQGDVYHVDGGPEREELLRIGLESWVAGHRDLFLRIVPTRVSGRRVGPASA